MKSKASKATPPPLKRSSQLWLLAVIALALAPHMTHQPTWVNFFVSTIWLWRTWLAWRGLPKPSKFFIIGLAAAGVFLTLATYGTLFGREAGVVLLQLMLVMKLVEMRTLRDAMVAVFLGFFVLLTHFLSSQTMLTGAYMLGVIWLFIVTLIALNRRDEPQFIEMAKTAGAIFVQSVPLMLVLFLLVPRVSGPLWGIPKESSSAISGLSEEMSPGSIGNLALSDAIAFRVEFDEKIPPVRALYWRTIIMNNFDGRTWRVSRSTRASPPSPIQAAGAPIRYRVTLEPHNQRWLSVLDLPKDTPPGTKLTYNYQLISQQPATTRLRYELSSYLEYRAGLDSTAQQLRDSLQIPPGNPRAVGLAESFKSKSTNPQEIVRQALAYFAAQGFVYTLTPPLLGEDSIDGFIFDSKAGFCEHYAGAFTFLMRAAGIPARVVTGYQGGEVNPIGNYLIVRQAEAHAWSEVWLPEHGWVRVDPTAAASPARVDSGIRAAIPAADLIPGLISAEQVEWLRSFSLSWDAANNQWNQWVLGYNFERQKRLLTQWGRKDVNWQDLVIALMIAAGVVLLSLSFYLLVRRTQRKRDPVLKVYEKFCMQLNKIGISRGPGEGPMDLASRASATAPEFASAIEEITAVYVGLRYGTQNAFTLVDLKRLVNQFPRKLQEHDKLQKRTKL